MERFTYPKPVKPQIVRDLDAIKRETSADLRAGLRTSVPSAAPSLAGFTATVYVSTLLQALSEEEREEIRAYNRAVTRYNAEVDAFNARQRTARQASANRRAVATVRSQSCGRCFATHAGEC